MYCISIHRIRDQRGQTLIELMAAIFVITTGLLGVLGLTTANVRSETTAVMRLTAFNFAREGVELARNVRDSNWLSDQPWSKGMTDLVTHCAGISTKITADAFVQYFSDIPSCDSNLFDDSYRIFFDSGLYTQDQVRAPSAAQTQYYRRILFDPICLNESGAVTETIKTSGGCDPSSEIMAGILVTSEVVYKMSGRTQSARIIERLYNWR